MKKICGFYAFFILFASLILSSCDDKVMGYSVVLWNIPEHHLQSGDTVKVYIRSNISHVYVAGDADGQKIEIPLWQLTEPVKKGKISAVQAKYAEYANTYASVKTDGLPARAEPVNTARQVYRLRKGEVIKILYQGKGQAPMTGGKPLEGEWYRILTDDGTQGWCFSYNLIFFETDEYGEQIGGEKIEVEDTTDARYDSILNKRWYPDLFKTLIRNGNIDTTRLNPLYNFRIDSDNETVTLNMTDAHGSWAYNGYVKTDDYQYTLKDIPIVITYKNAEYIVIRYTGESGKPVEYNLVTISEDINELVASEKGRRAQAYARIVAASHDVSSTNYGRLVLSADGTFQWTRFNQLVASEIISSAAKNSGTCSVKYAVSKNLSSLYDGVLTFRFNGMDKDVNFLYKLESGGIRFEDATGAKFNGNLVTERSSSPLILYFKNN